MEKLEGENPLIKESTSPSRLAREICFKITHRLNFLAFVRSISADKALRNYVVIIPLTTFLKGVSLPAFLPLGNPLEPLGAEGQVLAVFSEPTLFTLETIFAAQP